MTPVTTTPARRAARRPDATPSPWGMFLRGFIKHPVMVGSIVPSSRKLMDRMLDRVDWNATKLFVEYGPGTGNFCRAVLERLGPDATLLAIDTNADFVRYLRQTIRDPRLVVVLGSAADVRQIIADHGHTHADYVLSGLPFSTLPPGVGDAIGLATRDVVRPGGAFLVYQFTKKCRDFFGQHFGRIDYALEWWNVPPAHLYWAWADEAREEVDLAA